MLRPSADLQSVVQCVEWVVQCVEWTVHMVYCAVSNRYLKIHVNMNLDMGQGLPHQIASP